MADFKPHKMAPRSKRRRTDSETGAAAAKRARAEEEDAEKFEEEEDDEPAEEKVEEEHVPPVQAEPTVVVDDVPLSSPPAVEEALANVSTDRAAALAAVYASRGASAEEPQPAPSEPRHPPAIEPLPPRTTRPWLRRQQQRAKKYELWRVVTPLIVALAALWCPLPSAPPESRVKAYATWIKSRVHGTDAWRARAPLDAEGLRRELDALLKAKTKLEGVEATANETRRRALAVADIDFVEADDAPDATKLRASVAATRAAFSEIPRIPAPDLDRVRALDDRVEAVAASLKSLAVGSVDEPSHFIERLTTVVRERAESELASATAARLLQPPPEEPPLRLEEGLDAFVALRIEERVFREPSFDFASIRTGGTVLTANTTKGLVSAFYHLVMIQKGLPPQTVLATGGAPLGQHPLELGKCWAFKGTSGVIAIKLATSTVPASFALDHARTLARGFGDFRSAPYHFRVVGYKTEIEADGSFDLGSFVYDADGPQRFPAIPAPVPVSVVKLFIDDNHGASNYTCVYRFAVY